jgi:hypothetical protein
MHIHCIYLYIQCMYMYIHCTWVPRMIYHYCVCHCILACTSYNIGIYNAIIQESTIVYTQGYTPYIPPKNVC